jgi:hypothetical protein
MALTARIAPEIGLIIGRSSRVGDSGGIMAAWLDHWKLRENA